MNPVCCPSRQPITAFTAADTFPKRLLEAVLMPFHNVTTFIMSPLLVPAMLIIVCMIEVMERFDDWRMRQRRNVSRHVLKTAPATDRLPLLSMGTEEAVWGHDPMLDEQFSWDMSSINLGGEYGREEEERQRKRVGKPFLEKSRHQRRGG